MPIIALSGCPANEPCAQVGTRPEASDWSRHEAIAYRAGLIALYGPAPAAYALRVKANHHDFGTYYTVELTCPGDPALEDQTYETAAQTGISNWRDALMPAPIEYSAAADPAPIHPIDPSRSAIVRAIIASRPNIDGIYPIPAIAEINTNLRAEFPAHAQEADAALTA